MNTFCALDYEKRTIMFVMNSSLRSSSCMSYAINNLFYAYSLQYIFCHVSVITRFNLLVHVLQLLYVLLGQNFERYSKSLPFARSFSSRFVH
jgi:hypothetical protein